MTVEIKGCGCRYINHKTNLEGYYQKEYEYLCSTHKDQFILELYNERLRTEEE